MSTDDAPGLVQTAPCPSLEMNLSHDAKPNGALLAGPVGPVQRVIFIDDMAFTRECIARCLELASLNLEVDPFSSVPDCTRVGASDSRACIILYNIHGRSVLQDGIVTDLSELHRTFAGAPVILLSDIDAVDHIREAFANGTRGYIPATSTTLDIVVEVIRLVRAGGTFVPANGLAFGQVGERAVSKPARCCPFTPRQVAVLQHLRRGKANKIIAHELAMSESTVKVHVRNIMRKLKATNRTEVSYRLHGFTIDGGDGTTHELVERRRG